MTARPGRSDDLDLPTGIGMVTHGQRARLFVVAILSAVSGLLEAGTLVCLTTFAVSLKDGDAATVKVFLIDLSPRSALGVAAIGVVLKVALGYIIVRLSAGLAARTLRDQRAATLADFFAADHATQAAEPLGNLQEVLTSNVDRVAGISLTLTSTITASLNLAALVVGALFVRPAAAVFMIAGGAVVAGFLHPLRGKAHQLATRHVKANSHYASAVTEAVRLAREVRIFNAGPRVVEAIQRRERESSESYRTSRVVQGLSPQLYQSSALLLVIGGLALAQGQDVDPATLGAVVLLLIRSLAYLQGALGGRQQLADQLPHLERVRALRQAYREHRVVRGSEQPADLRSLDADDITFEYETGRPALADFSLHIPPGEVVGVIGRSGAGKTTLSELVLGLRDADVGTFTAGGVDIRQIDPAWWSRRVAFVPQEPMLINGTIRENIEFYRDGDDAALERAARRANIHDDIARLPGSYDTPLGELGGALSGGQRQRICIARALFGAPQVLLLDEPTSALDALSEAVVHTTIKQLAGEVTVIVVTHRTSTLHVCDRVAVLDHGRLVAFETPAVLEQADGFYRDVLQVALEEADDGD